jgi:hypothetical protein
MTGIPTLDEAVDATSVDAAADVSRRFFAAHPDAHEQFGEAGRAYTDHDNAYLVQWVRDAVALGSGRAFERNVTWLWDLLAARDFPRDWFVADLELVAAVCVERGLISAAAADTIVSPVVATLGDR